MTKDMITAAQRLVEVLARENAALAALDFRRAENVLPEKEAAASAFAAAQQRGGSEWAGSSDPEQLRRERAIATRLRELAYENKRLLEQAITVQGRVLGSFAKVMARVAPRVQSAAYGASGVRPDTARLPVVLSARI